MNEMRILLVAAQVSLRHNKCVERISFLIKHFKSKYFESCIVHIQSHHDREMSSSCLRWRSTTFHAVVSGIMGTCGQEYVLCHVCVCVCVN